MNQDKDLNTEEQHIIDDARKYFLEGLPSDIPLDQAYLHIGMYLGWVIENELYSEDFEDEFGAQIIRFKKRDTSCVIVGELWDGIVFSEQFSDPKGQKFADYYYRSGTYMKDFEQTLAEGLDSIFKVKDNWENFTKMQEVINNRYIAWEAEVWNK